ncbi:MAG TPA: response regulator [Thermoanaerobaculia bacterium]|jgi:signal transduction histidine kinase/DNA-binding response OmpR family regulator|nr:response regulator [Thermoanaerobaculia bacterium]
MPASSEPRESVVRFDLAIQKSHLFVYAAALVVSLLGRAFGVFPLRLGAALFCWAASSAIALLFYELFRRRYPRSVLNPLWITTDVVLVTSAVFATGGINSPWYLFYLTIAAAAAFASGKRAAYAVCVGSALAYLAIMMATGQAVPFDPLFLRAVTRMLFLFGASFYFLSAIADLQQKRLRIRALESEEKQQIDELRRLTGELEGANRRIQESDRLKSQFLANMSHELRTPLNSIIGFSEILVDRLQGNVDAKHYGFLNHIHASGQHLLGIINDILDLSKIEAGKMEIYPEFFAIAPVIESVCHMMRGMTKTHPRFVVDVPNDLPLIETDLAKFKQVLFNLVSNGIKFSPADSTITISARFIGARDEDGSINVSVSDEGIGIDPDHHEMIFEEFRQIDATVRREFGGTGLGLALVKRFVELQGGHVSVESSPGRGSTFSFRLPVRSRAAVVSRAAEIEPAEDRILVVEDDPNAYDLIASALRSAGYSAARARYGEEAIRLAGDLRPLAITLDLVLPGLDGWEVLKRLKAEQITREIPIIIISVVENRDLGMALGADDYFVKPVDRERFLDRVRALASRSDARPRLLLIDDDAAVHALLDAELSTAGYAMDSAFNGEQGLLAAREKSPDVIILDLMMPGMSGFEVADSLKEDPLTANIPILVLTSKEISADERRDLQTKVTSFVQKGKSARAQLIREIRRIGQQRTIANVSS